MSMSEPTYLELQRRLQREIDYYGSLPERNAIAWWAYLGALNEWGLISTTDFIALVKMLPHVTDNPIFAIATGKPGDRDGE